MFTKRSWILVALVIVVWGVWHGSQTIEYVYSERYTDEGLRQSAVVCGQAPLILAFDRFDDDVRGPATQADCVRLARTRTLEALGILALAAIVGTWGYRHGAEPPRPIDELPRLPTGDDRVVRGRHRRR